MSAVEQWVEGKSPEIAAGALTIALSIPEVSEALSEMRDQVDTKISQPPLDEWLSFYTHHRAILDILENLFSIDGLQKFYTKSGNDNDLDLSSQERDQFIQLYLQPETLFFLKVWAPCSIHYKTDPTILFRKARQGKISALEKLLRLDNSVLFDKKLSEIFHQHKGKANKKNYRKLLLAFHNPVSKKTDLKRMKILAAGLISYLSEHMGKRLTMPQIRGLFDAIAADAGHGMCDKDIAESSDTFTQAIRRESKKLKALENKPYKR